MFLLETGKLYLVPEGWSWSIWLDTWRRGGETVGELKSGDIFLCVIDCDTTSPSALCPQGPISDTHRWVQVLSGECAGWISVNRRLKFNEV